MMLADDIQVKHALGTQDSSQSSDSIGLTSRQACSGPLFTKRQDVLPQDLEVSKPRDSGLDFSNRSDM